jgi:PTH1 family peptidyl-tRNA hydrolase
MAEALAEYLGFSFRKTWFRPYHIAGGIKDDLAVVKPLTYMNRSGLVLPHIMRKYRLLPEQVIVLVDQMDLGPGQFRLRRKGGNAGHNGLKSIESYLMSQNYPRLYIGIGRPQGGDNVIDHVLDPPFEEEGKRILKGIKALAPILAEVKDRSLEAIMGDINGQFSS